MRSLTLKLILAFVAICVLEAVLVAALVRESTQRSFDRFVEQDRLDRFAEQARTYYELRGSWDGIEEWVGRRRRRTSNDRRTRRFSSFTSRIALIDADGLVRIGSADMRAGMRLPARRPPGALEIESDGTVVGYVLPDRGPSLRGALERQYLDRTDRALALALFGALGVSLIVGVLAARSYMKPLRELTDATQSLSQGRWGEQVPVRTRDELSTLTIAFNELSATVAKQMELRRQMTADIAHDLRTPLTVLIGYLEAIRDGDLEATPERIDTMHQEAKRLGRLIEDLRMLSLADAGELALQRKPTRIPELLQSVVDRFAHQATERAINLTLRCDDAIRPMNIDPDRIDQVLGNLVSNALRYTPGGGTIAITAEESGNDVLIRVSDTGAGIAPDVLPRIFERFYRADESRNRENGESGLGLAIARSFVEAHGGKIDVSSTVGAGTTFTIRLPGNR